MIEMKNLYTDKNSLMDEIMKLKDELNEVKN